MGFSIRAYKGKGLGLLAADTPTYRHSSEVHLNVLSCHTVDIYVGFNAATMNFQYIT